MKLRYLLIVLTLSVVMPGCCWFHHHHRHCCKPFSPELNSLPVSDNVLSLPRPHASEQ